MALTATEEALLRDLLAKQAELIALANNETTITAKLGSTKATIDDLTAATTVADADLMILRQGGVDKKLPVSVVKSDLVDLSSYAPLASPALTGTPTAPTATAGTNTKQIATTEFVQRALGSLSGGGTITGGASLGAADIGTSIQLAGAGGYAVTLPASADVSVGSAILLQCSSAGSVTVKGAGTDQIHPALNTSLTSFTMTGGDSALLVKQGNGVWGLALGSAQLKYAPQFNSSLATSGYQKLPSGLIIQWGALLSVAAGGTTLVLPIGFPSAFTAFSAIDAGNGAYSYGIQITSSAGGNVYCRNLGTLTNGTCYWMAVGY